MRILHAIHSLAGGGAERQLQLLCRTSKDPGFRHAVFCVNDSGNTIPPGTTRLYKAAESNPLSRGYLASLRAAIADFDPHIVHAWLPASMTIPAMVIGWSSRRPVIFSYRSKMRFHRPLSYPEFIAALICSSRIISNNPIVDSHPAFRWLFRRKQGVVIRNAVSIPDNIVREGPFPRNGRQWRIACVGRLTTAKNFGTVIEAASRLPAGNAWHLDIYGEGELRKDIAEAIEKHGLRENITLHGFQHDVYTRMAASDLLVMPSLWEGMPNVALEAMTIGLPILLSDIPTHRELLTDHDAVGWVRPDQPDDIAAAIGNCLTGQTDLARMVAKGRLFASSFSPAQMADEHHRYYSSIATGKQP